MEDNSFYNSKAWRQCRAQYKKKVNGLCERCLAKGYFVPGEHVHHKVYMNEKTVQDPELALGFDNLELLCHKCHDNEHKRKQKRWKYIDGVLVDVPDAPLG